MPQKLPIHLFCPVIPLFLDQESPNINGLILIFFPFARAGGTSASTARAGAPVGHFRSGVRGPPLIVAEMSLFARCYFAVIAAVMALYSAVKLLAKWPILLSFSDA